MTKTSKEMEPKVKRSYTVPVLLVIITLMMLVIVIVSSRYLVQQQQDWLEDGQRLAEKYEESVLFAQKLRDGADVLLGGSGRETEGKMLLAQAMAHSRHFVDLLAEAEHMDKKIRVKEARERYAAEMKKLYVRLGAIGESGQWFEAPDRQTLEAVREAGVQMSEALGRYRLPTVDSGYRMMAAGEGWLEHALAAAAAWANLAGRL